ncbi:MAG TPA: DHA2 family efflux MFS transporter permease subunit [Mycobacterium sp.]|uniref:DHA2 family efflux MFS transporter permease subunit n=1 Tax=Mycobacterium sp. TaxID=1785 RepID=UPI002BECF63F|nr:DHA2 family efflux MFS transporter permease subunit [Mycobacterium sp.]HME75646.1 DHA2 family efflux MFS transporter permease subunit [Mycobacterium sp.]
MKTWWSASGTSGKAMDPVANPRSEESVKLDSRLLKITVLYMLAPTMAALDTTIVYVAQRTFVDEFSSTQAIVAWTMTAYTLSLAAVIPLTGWAANRFGTKRLILGSVLLFSLGSLLCATASNVTLLVTFRALQGLGGGILLPLTFTILTREAGPGRLARALAIGGVPGFIAPICGPILGGWLIGSFGWQWIFLVNVPIGLFTLVLAGFVLPKDEPASAESLDVVGMLLLSPGLVMLLYGASLIPGRGTVSNPRVYVPVAVGFTLIVVFVFHALYRASNPLIDLGLLRNRMVASANATRFLYAVGFFGTCLLLPGYFQQVLGKTPLQSGLLLLPQTLTGAAVAPLVGHLTEKRGPRDVVLAGMTLIVAGMGVFIYGISQHRVHIPVLLAGLAVFGIGTGCSMMPVAWTAVHTLETREIAHGSTLFNVNHNAAAAIGAALMSVLLTSILNRSADIVAARRADSILQDAARRGVAPDLSKLPHQVFAPDFMEHVTKDLSRAYAMVFAAAAILVATTFIPVWFLPKKPTGNPPALAPAGCAHPRTEAPRCDR